MRYISVLILVVSNSKCRKEYTVRNIISTCLAQCEKFKSNLTLRIAGKFGSSQQLKNIKPDFNSLKITFRVGTVVTTEKGG